ncbi:MAG: hypothetical protein AAFU41_00325 [Pseudomonadota bacterium]
MFRECTETVSILEAVIFGAGDACVMISGASLFWAFAAFILVVVILQFIARRIWQGITSGSSPDNSFDDPKPRTGQVSSPYRPYGDRPRDPDGPIR